MAILRFIPGRRILGSVNPIGIRSCYDEGKRIAETLAFDYHGKMMWTFVARPFNTYGRMLKMMVG